MKRPSRYYVAYFDPAKMAELEHAGKDFDPGFCTVERDVPNLAIGRALIGQHGGQLRERQDIRDVTPPEDGGGILWDYEDVLLEDL